MRSKILFVSCALVLFCVAAISAAGQAPKADWMRVQSDDGEFSIEVPANYKYYFNKNGFTIGRFNQPGNYWLKNMRMLNSYDSGSLLSFEAYETTKGALNSFYEDDTYKRKDLQTSIIHRNGFSIKQLVEKKDNFYLVRQYFYSRNNIYILFAGSRDGETPQIRRFLDSLLFMPGVIANKVNRTSFSSLQMTDIAFEIDSKKNTPIQGAAIASNPDDKESLTILLKPRPSYTDSARTKNITGTIYLQGNFSEDGFMPEIVVMKSLPEGLLQQALFAAIRIKFLPKFKEGKPVSLVRQFEYSFSIY